MESALSAHMKLVRTLAFFQGKCYLNYGFLRVFACRTAKQQLCLLLHQSQLIQLPDVLFSRGHEVNTSGFDAAVAQYVCQPHHVVAGAIEGAGEQAAEVMWEHLTPFHARRRAQPFHFGPDLLPVHSHTALGDENFTRGDFLFFGVFL